MYYSPPTLEYYTGRPAAYGEYLYQEIKTYSLEQVLSLEKMSAKKDIAQSVSKQKNHFGLLGYGVDDGVLLNHGRVGAAAGPNAFRECFGKLAALYKKQVTITDYGTILCPNKNLEAAQCSLGNAVAELLLNRVQPIVIGGGHDMAYGHFLGIQKYLTLKYPKAQLGILNLDAHLDLRLPSPEGTSGSPFLQIALELERIKKDFNYCCVGLRENANTPWLIAKAEALNSCLIYRNMCEMSHWKAVKEKINQFLARVDFVYLSIDLDAFHCGIAPGVSAASPLGLGLEFGMNILREVNASGKIISMDIAELNPRYDIEMTTAKLAAGLAYEHISF